MWWICLFLLFGSAYCGPASQPLYHSQYVSAQNIPTVQYRAQPQAAQYLTQATFDRTKGQGLQQYSTQQAADGHQSQKTHFGGPLYLQQIQAAQQQAETPENYPVQRKGTIQSFGRQPVQQAQYVQPQQVRYVHQKATPDVYKAKLRQGAERQEEEEEDYDPNPSYQFGFDVKDDLYTNYQNRKEQKEGNKITGSYSVVDSDGFIRTVTYTADPKEGFKAEVSRTPTDIVVKIPKRDPPQFERHRPEQQYLQVAPSRRAQPRPTEKENAIYQYQ